MKCLNIDNLCFSRVWSIMFLFYYIKIQQISYYIDIYIVTYWVEWLNQEPLIKLNNKLINRL